MEFGLQEKHIQVDLKKNKFRAIILKLIRLISCFWEGEIIAMQFVVIFKFWDIYVWSK